MTIQRILGSVFLLTGGSLLVSCRSDIELRSTDMAEMMVAGVAVKVREYEMLCGELPSEEEGLEALVARPESLAKNARWRKLYDEVPDDPWGNRLYYLVDEKLRYGFGIYSCGPDGISRFEGNDRDDIKSWD